MSHHIRQNTAGSFFISYYRKHNEALSKHTAQKRKLRQKEESMKTAIYPGSFDPITFGHIDIIERASKIFDRLVVGVLNNQSKQPLFTVDERVSMLKTVTKNLPNVEITSFCGLLVDFAKAYDSHVVVRGLRAITDFEYELQMSQTNHILAPELDTVFLTTDLKYSYLSSTTVREVASFHGDISAFVPEFVEREMRKKFL